MKRPPKVYHRTLRTLRNVLLALLALWLWWASQGYPALTPRQALRWQEQVHMVEKVDYLDTLPVGLKDKDRLRERIFWKCVWPRRWAFFGGAAAIWCAITGNRSSRWFR